MAEGTGPVQAEALSAARMPWSPHGDTAANLAIASLRDSVLASLKGERGIHAETLFVTIGAIAGQAVAHAVWEQVHDGKVLLKEISARGGLHLFFGEELNAYLVPQAGSLLPIWNLVAGAAVEAGVPMAELPDWQEIFAHVSRTAAGAEFGIVRTPQEHQPGLQPRQALRLVWPLAHAILSSPVTESLSTTPGPSQGEDVNPPESFGVGKPMRGMFGRKGAPPPGSQTGLQPGSHTGPQAETFAKKYWPIGVGLVAQQYVRMSKDLLDPRLAVRLFMEAAVPMSKLNPQEFPLKPMRHLVGAA
ncbi:MAG TPA: hypothetical protein VMW18_21380 [Candidatus Binatia bacterium]|nr:hypothetical protein [Candidatus Binatia bacterium]